MNDEQIMKSQQRNRTEEHLKNALTQIIKKKAIMPFLSRISLIRRVTIAVHFTYIIKINSCSPKTC